MTFSLRSVSAMREELQKTAAEVDAQPWTARRIGGALGAVTGGSYGLYHGSILGSLAGLLASTGPTVPVEQVPIRYFTSLVGGSLVGGVGGAYVGHRLGGAGGDLVGRVLSSSESKTAEAQGSPPLDHPVSTLGKSLAGMALGMGAGFGSTHLVNKALMSRGRPGLSAVTQTAIPLVTSAVGMTAPLFHQAYLNKMRQDHIARQGRHER